MEKLEQTNELSFQSAPLISIIVATYNGAKTLQHCIDSIAKQNYSNKELIIIDGGSKDETLELLKKNKNVINYWLSEPDRGVYNAWNKGLKQAKGDWICFLGSDDYFWDEQVLRKMAETLRQLPSDIRVAYAKVMIVNTNRESLYTIGEPWKDIKNRFRQLMSIPHPGAMHRNSLFQHHGRYDESFRIAADYEMLLRELKTGDAYYFPDLITVGMMQGGISSDPANSLLSMREMRRAQKMHGQQFPGWLWLMAMARVYVRVLMRRLLGEGFASKVLALYRRAAQQDKPK